MKRVLTSVASFFFATSLSIAALAETQSKSLTLFNDVQVNGKTLPAGQYKVKVDSTGSTAQVTFMQGKKEVASAPAQLKPLANKQNSTQIQLNSANGKPQLDEIDFGGSTTGMSFASATPGE